MPANCVAANVGNTSWAANPSDVEHMAAFGRLEGADGAPPLGLQQFHRVVDERHRAGGGPLGGFGHGTIGQGTGPAEGERPQPLTGGFVGELLEPTREFHHMTVGVEHDAIPYVRHARDRIAVARRQATSVSGCQTRVPVKGRGPPAVPHR